MHGNRAESQLHGVTKEIERSREAGLICCLGENCMLFFFFNLICQIEWLVRENLDNYQSFKKKHAVLSIADAIFEVASLVEHTFRT